MTPAVLRGGPHHAELLDVETSTLAVTRTHTDAGGSHVFRYARTEQFVRDPHGVLRRVFAWEDPR